MIVSLAVVVSACSRAAPQSELPTQLLPASLPTVDAAGATQKLRVRVYAGAAFRARVVGWQEELALVVASTSAILQEATGVGIEVVETIDWKRSGGHLGKTLQSLSSLDRGVDVDLVIGLIDAPKELERRYSQLVDSQILGRHLVVRSFNRQAESAALGPSAAGLDEAAQDELLDRRRRHKQALLLAVGIARLFGGPDAGQYSITDTELDPASAAIVSITMAAHLAEAEASSEPAASELWAKVEAQLQPLHVDPKLLEGVRRRGAGGASDKSKAEPEAALRSVDREKLENVRNLLKEGKASTGWEVLEPLTELYPDDLSIVALACAAAYARHATDALTRCQRAVALSDDDAPSWLRLGRLQVENEPGAALRSLHRASGLMSDSDPGWGTLAEAYQKLSLASLALKAGRKSKTATAVVSWSLQSLSRYGSNVGVNETSEGEYLVALQHALKLVYKNDYKAANASAESLHKTFPKSIAKDLIDCEIAVRRRKYSLAQGACQAVITRQSDNAWARYLLGIVHLREKREAPAIVLLHEAITKDPGLKAAYEALAKVYAPRSDARLAPLRAQYKEQFGVELK